MLAVGPASCGLSNFQLIPGGTARVHVFALVRDDVSIHVDGNWEDYAETKMSDDNFGPDVRTDFTLDAEHLQLTEDPQEVDLGEATSLRPGRWKITTTITPTSDPAGPIVCGFFIGATNTGVAPGSVTTIQVHENARNCTGPNDGGEVQFTHDVAVLDVQAPATQLQNIPGSIEVTVANLGNRNEENLSITLTGTGGLGPSQTLDHLNISEVKPFSFPWNPSSASSAPDYVAAGGYTITATAAAVPAETATANNSRTTSVIVVANSDTDTIPDAAPDNCPSVANPGQEDCDGDGVGDVCDTPEIRGFTPTCNPISAGQPISVVGFGFGSVVESQILVAGTAVAPGNIATQETCYLIFRSPVSSLTSSGTLVVGNAPPVALCPSCPATIKIRGFFPIEGQKTTTLVKVLGCGFSATPRVYLEPATGGTRIGPLSLAGTPTAEIVAFTVPGGAVSGTKYKIVVQQAAPSTAEDSLGDFKVQ